MSIQENTEEDCISQLIEEMIDARLSGNLPAHLPTIFNMINCEEEVTKFDSIIEVSVASNPNRKLHQQSKKGSFMTTGQISSLDLMNYKIN